MNTQILDQIIFIPNPDLGNCHCESRSAGRSILALFKQIATPACRNSYFLELELRWHTSACNHAFFPAFSGARNNTTAKGFSFLNRDLGLYKFLTFVKFAVK
jgi:hypothetical protein